jgi:hypothetical protein
VSSWSTVIPDGSALLVVQSHRQPLPAPWYEACVASVRSWARARGYGYRWYGDELFDRLPAELLEKCRDRPVVAADLARLRLLEALLADGFERVVWIDADVLVLRPARFDLPEADALFGREVWIQVDAAGRLRTYRKIHNALLAFTAASPVLPFYRYAAERIVARHRGRMVAQLVGPKLLTLLHNAIGFEVLETAGMLSPAVARDVVAGGGAALTRFRTACAVEPAALNLCGSAVAAGQHSDAFMDRLVATLTARPGVFGS